MWNNVDFEAIWGSRYKIVKTSDFALYNKASIHIPANPIYHDRTKHTEIYAVR